MAHMKKGYDKKAKILKEPELTEDLKESTKLLQDAWPGHLQSPFKPVLSGGGFRAQVPL